MNPSISNDHLSLEDEDWDEEEEEMCMTGPCLCLFCAETGTSAEACLDHLQSQHEVDLKEICQKLSLSSYGYIQMVNYIRKHKMSSADFNSISSKDLPWKDPRYLVPENNEDPLLMLDLVPYDSPNDDLQIGRQEPVGAENGSALDSNAVNGYNMSKAEFDEKLRSSEHRCNELHGELQRAVRDLTKIKECVKELYTKAESSTPSCRCNAIQDLREDEDEAYFGSYGHFSIHREMLQDRVRTEAYQNFILSNQEVFQDKIVLDAGCGTGILSMFAAKAGAKKVIAIDQSEIVYKAIDIVKENGFEDVINVSRGKIENTMASVEKVDIIITEWMGYFLLFESMLDTILYARDKFLVKGGLIFPNKCSTHLVAVDDDKMRKTHVQFWDDVFGFKMSCMKTDVVREASVEIVKPDTVISESCLLKEIDISTVTLKGLDYMAPLSVKITQDGNINALVGYFDVIFEGTNMKTVIFSTSPQCEPTHWKQTIFLVEPPMPVKKDDVLTGTLSCMKNRKSPRTLIVQITLGDWHSSYIIE